MQATVGDPLNSSALLSSILDTIVYLPATKET